MKNIIELAKQTINTEIEALQGMELRIDQQFEKAVNLVLQASGRVVVVGMGKSGIIGQKIAATLASTGTPSFFVHPGEAFHGDLGMIKPIDIALMISNSGDTEEVIRLLPFLQHQKNKVIAITGKRESTLAKNADAVLDVAVAKEACTNNLAPTSSTTATLVMGDALAIVLSNARNFQPEDFAKFHPGGSLGRKLLTRVRDIMQKENLPICAPNASFRDVVYSINQGRLGLVLVQSGEKLKGIITDGDVRRAFDAVEDYKNIKAESIMTVKPVTADLEMRFADAEELMKRHKINSLVALNSEGNAVGVVQIYDFGNK
jgi:arabinose-5-phosphate isomerase